MAHQEFDILKKGFSKLREKYIQSTATVLMRLVKLLQYITRNIVEKLNGLVKPLSLGVGISFTPPSARVQAG